MFLYVHMFKTCQPVRNDDINYYISYIPKIFFHILLLLAGGCVLESVTSLNCYQPGGSHDINVIASRLGLTAHIVIISVIDNELPCKLPVSIPFSVYKGIEQRNMIYDKSKAKRALQRNWRTSWQSRV